MSPRTAVVLVTHNSHRYLPETLASIQAQETRADQYLAIDDHSSDSTRDLLIDASFTVELATSPATDVTTRIAHNFQQGLRRAQLAGSDVVILGDHDDIWHQSRISHQVELLERSSTAAMVASNGYLIDANGVAVAGTLRDTFPVPAEFASWPGRKQWAYALRHSLATGGASALRLANLTDWSIPPGWLHDRWWSLLALQQKALLIDPTRVIDYRLSATQQVGLDTANQEHGAVWALGKVRNLARTGRRSRDVIRLVR